MVERRLFLADANVLIDILAVDRAMLPLIAKHLGPVHVPRRLVEREVKALKDVDCAALGLSVVVETVEQLTAAAAVRGGPLSALDHLLVLLSEANRWTCITNDVALRLVLARRSLPMVWGLELLLDLIAMGALSAADAVAFARAVAAVNPRLASSVIEEFCRKARAIDA